MRRDTQLWLAGTTVFAISLATLVVIHQRDQLSQQQQAIEQQNLQANDLTDSSDEADRLRRQEETFALQLKSLDVEQAKNEATASANQASQAVKDQQAQERQRLEGQIQDLKAQRAQRAHLAECNQTQTSLRSAERAGDDAQVKSLQDRWSANCAS